MLRCVKSFGERVNQMFFVWHELSVPGLVLLSCTHVAVKIVSVSVHMCLATETDRLVSVAQSRIDQYRFLQLAIIQLCQVKGENK